MTMLTPVLLLLATTYFMFRAIATASKLACLYLEKKDNNEMHLIPPLEPFAYDCGYGHLDTQAAAERAESGTELPDGEYSEGQVVVPKAAL